MRGLWAVFIRHWWNPANSDCWVWDLAIQGYSGLVCIEAVWSTGIRNVGSTLVRSEIVERDLVVLADTCLLVEAAELVGRGCRSVHSAALWSLIAVCKSSHRCLLALTLLAHIVIYIAWVKISTVLWSHISMSQTAASFTNRNQSRGNGEPGLRLLPWPKLTSTCELLGDWRSKATFITSCLKVHCIWSLQILNCEKID